MGQGMAIKQGGASVRGQNRDRGKVMRRAGRGGAGRRSWGGGGRREGPGTGLTPTGQQTCLPNWLASGGGRRDG